MTHVEERIVVPEPPDPSSRERTGDRRAEAREVRKTDRGERRRADRYLLVRLGHALGFGCQLLNR